MLRVSPAPNELLRIRAKAVIRRLDRHSLGLRLSDEEAIERVTVLLLKLRNRERVTVCNRRRPDASGRRTFWNTTSHRFRQC